MYKNELQWTLVTEPDAHIQVWTSPIPEETRIRVAHALEWGKEAINVPLGTLRPEKRGIFSWLRKLLR